MNLGNSTRVNPVDKLENNNSEQIAYDFVKNSEYNNKTTKKKRFGRKEKAIKDLPPQSTTSETLWREVNMFWPETIAIVKTLTVDGFQKVDKRQSGK